LRGSAALGRLFRQGVCGRNGGSFCYGHVAAFDFFGGVPQSILYDNTKLAVAKIVKGGRRLRSKTFAELQSHYLFEDRGDRERAMTRAKWKRNFMTPLPMAESVDAFNIRLLDACSKRRQANAATLRQSPSGCRRTWRHS
jgi:transposase